MKRKVECEDCGKVFEENGVYDLAISILHHKDTAECAMLKSTNNESIACTKEDLQ